MNRYLGLSWFLPAITAFLVLSALFAFSMWEQEKLIAKETTQVIERRQWQADFIASRIEQQLKLARASSASLQLLLAQQLSDKQLPLSTQFDNFFQQQSDQSVRSLRGNFNPQRQAGLFLPANTELNPDKKQQLLQLKQSIEQYALGAAGQAFVNSWFMNTDGGIVIYWPQQPEFVFSAQANFSYLDSEWLQKNKAPGTYWTKLIKDPIPQVWMLSAVTPIYHQGQWLGAVGHDIPLNNLLRTVGVLENDAGSEFILLNDRQQITASNIAETIQVIEQQHAPLSELQQGIWQQAYQQLQAHQQKSVNINGRLFTLSPIPSQNWTLLTSIPLTPVTHKIRSTFSELQLIAVVSILAEMLFIMAFMAFSHIRNKKYINELKTASAQIKAEKQRYKTLVDNIPSIVYQCQNDTNWTMLYLNGSVDYVTGYQTDELLNNHNLAFADLILPQDKDYVWDEVQHALNEHGLFELVFRIRHKNGEVRWMLERGYYSSDKSVIEGVITDITQLKNAEIQLQQLNETLDNKVQDRTAALEQANTNLTAQTIELQTSLKQLHQTQEKLVNAEKMSSLNHLIVGMAHEMNTPLGNIKTTESVIQNSARKLLQHAQQNNLKRSMLLNKLQTIEQCAESSLSSIDTLINLSQSFKGLKSDSWQAQQKMNFNLAQAIADSINFCRSRLQQQNVQTELEIDPSLHLYGTPHTIHSIFTELINNSLEHAGFKLQSPGKISIHSQPEKHQLVITYTDSGQGVKQLQSSELFSPFTTSARGKGFTGLGLSKVYNIVCSELQGEIKHIPSQQGICFKIYLEQALFNHKY